jgi:outer membrane protein assembly factor BamB
VVTRHRLATAAALAALTATIAVAVIRRRHTAAPAAPRGHPSAAASAAASAKERSAPPPGARVKSGPPSMIHLDPRHTNRSPFDGPLRPRLLWTFDAGSPIEAAPAVLDDGTIVVATLGGTLYGLSPDGSPRFRADLGDRIYSSPLVLAGTVFVGSDAHRFFGIRPTGTVRWQLDTDGDADTGAAPTPSGGLVFGSGKLLYSTRLDGTVVWRAKARRKTFSSPAVADDGTVYAGSQDNHVYAIAQDGRLRWRADVGADADSAPAIGDDGTVYIGTDGGSVLALSPEDGSVRWRAKVGGFVRGALSIGRDGTVLAGTYGPTPRLVALSPTDGRIRFEFAVPGTGAAEFGIHGGPVEDSSGRLYFGAQDDCVYALAPGGALLWKWATHGDVDAPVVIARPGLLLAGSDDGKLYAIENSREGGS